MLSAPVYTNLSTYSMTKEDLYKGHSVACVMKTSDAAAKMSGEIGYKIFSFPGIWYGIKSHERGSDSQRCNIETNLVRI